VAEDAMERARQLGGHFPLFAALRAWLAAFERLDTPLWAQRARSELTRIDAAEQTPGTLTAAEQRVAELAASGMTSRDVAAALFISRGDACACLPQAWHPVAGGTRAAHGRTMTATKAFAEASINLSNCPKGGALNRSLEVCYACRRLA
jgi:hypothetical protein